MKQQSGFTLIELIMVIVILGILAATALPKFVNLGTDARAAAMKAVEGSMRSTNAIIYAKAAMSNSLAATSSVTINGVSGIGTVYGFAKDVTEMAKVMDLSTDFSADNTTAPGMIKHTGATTPATCSVTYTAATATAAPQYSTAINGC